MDGEMTIGRRAVGVFTFPCGVAATRAMFIASEIVDIASATRGRGRGWMLHDVPSSTLCVEDGLADAVGDGLAAHGVTFVRGAGRVTRAGETADGALH